MNSFTAAPGEMVYDQDASDDQPTNAVCPDCKTRFWKGRDDLGDLCDGCSNELWEREKARRAQNEDLVTRAVRNWFRKTDVA